MAGRPRLATNLGESPVDSAAPAQAGEVVVVEGHVGHDGALVRLQAGHVLGVQQLSNAQLTLGHAESKGEVVQRAVWTQGAVVQQARPGQTAERAPQQRGLWRWVRWT